MANILRYVHDNEFGSCDRELLVVCRLHRAGCPEFRPDTCRGLLVAINGQSITHFNQMSAILATSPRPIEVVFLTFAPPTTLADDGKGADGAADEDAPAEEDIGER